MNDNKLMAYEANRDMRARQSSVLMGARYPATIDKQPDGSFMVSFVDLPNTFTEGETKEEALNNAAEVLSGMKGAFYIASMPKPKVITTVWDPAEHLETEDDMAAYLEAALEEGDPSLIASVRSDIDRAKGMTQIAAKIER